MKGSPALLTKVVHTLQLLGLNMNYRRFSELFQEFDKFIFSLNTLYLDSLAGFNILHQRLKNHQNDNKLLFGECEETSSDFQDKCGIDFSQLYGIDLYAAYLSPHTTQREFKQRTLFNGTNEPVAQ